MNADDYARMSNELSRWDDCAESDIERLQIVAKQLNDEISMLNAELARLKMELDSANKLIWGFNEALDTITEENAILKTTIEDLFIFTDDSLWVGTSETLLDRIQNEGIEIDYSRLTDVGITKADQ